MIVIRIPPLDEIARRWNEIEPLLKRATDRTQGCYEPVDVLAMVCAGRLGMLLIEDDRLLVAAAIEVRVFPRRKVLDVSFIGGAPSNDTGVREWVPLLVERLEDMARECGATMISGCGRIGWARAGGFKIAGGYVTRDVGGAA